jgi:L-amino acid N-acyltransferase YncA
MQDLLKYFAVAYVFFLAARFGRQGSNMSGVLDLHGYELRDATVADAGQLAAIYNATVLARDATMDLAPKNEQYFRELIAGLTEREALIVLAEREKVLGWGRIMRYSDREGYTTTCETAVYLRRELRRRGLGTRIKVDLIERCRKLGYHHLVAKVFAGNRASIDYNLRLGFEIVGTQREVGWVGGRWEDVTIMQLLLADVTPPGD